MRAEGGTKIPPSARVLFWWKADGEPPKEGSVCQEGKGGYFGRFFFSERIRSVMIFSS